VGLAPGTVRVRTFHALGREILADSGIDVRRIVDRVRVLDEIALGTLTPAAHRWLDESFTRLKLDPERGPPASDTATHAAFAAYTKALADRAALDLDDLVARSIPVLSGDKTLLARWRGRCRTLFVDEAQDLDRAQLELTVLLAGEACDVFLVGDDDQTIYAWRLADVRRVLGLASRLPGLRRVDLETNHRCAPEIVDRAARLVGHNLERFAKRIRSSPRTSGGLTLAPDPGDEVARARQLLTRWLQRDSGSHAILARTNGGLSPYAAVAREMSVPYHVAEDGLLLQDEWVDAIIEAARAPRITTSGPLLLELKYAANGIGAPADLTSSLLAWAAPFHDVDTFAAAVADRSAATPSASGDDSTLTLATVHGTKGLEWDHVACVGFDDGAFPSARSIREASEPGRALEEERRLAYVAWTRARTTLTIVYDPAAPSVFLREAFDSEELA
jgi:superfamily I DNA/RNA helicase